MDNAEIEKRLLELEKEFYFEIRPFDFSKREFHILGFDFNNN